MESTAKAVLITTLVFPLFAGELFLESYFILSFHKQFRLSCLYFLPNTNNVSFMAVLQYIETATFLFNLVFCSLH